MPVVENSVGAERAHELDILRAAHGRDVRAKVFRELHRRAADRSRRAVHDDARSRTNRGLPQVREREDRAVAQRRRFSERHACRHHRNRRVLLHQHILGLRAEHVRVHAEHSVTDRELRHGVTDRLDDPGELSPENPLLRSDEAAEEPDDERLRGAEPAVGAIDCARVHLDQQLVGSRARLRHQLDVQHVGRPIALVHDGAHLSSVLLALIDAIAPPPGKALVPSSFRPNRAECHRGRVIVTDGCSADRCARCAS